MPVLDGKFRNSSMAASNPPAEPPTPTIGQPPNLLAVALLLDARRALAVVTARRRARGFVVLALGRTRSSTMAHVRGLLQTNFDQTFGPNRT